MALLEKTGLILYADAQSSEPYLGTLSSSEQFKIPIEKLDRDSALKKYSMYTPPPGLSAVLEPAAGFVRVNPSIVAHSKMPMKLGGDLKVEPVVRFEMLENGL